MALSRRTGTRFQASIWPGFVDAMTGLLLVLMFVLTIFMVVQFVLRETISGQESKLDALSAEVAALARALGLEQDRNASLTERVGELTATLGDARELQEQQSALIAALQGQTEEQAAALNAAQARIVSFEEQVAGLLSEREANLGQIADLEGQREELLGEQERLLSEQEQLQLALAGLRDEIDEQVEEARLAAARREALEALIADLRRRNVEGREAQAALSSEVAELETALSEEEKARLAEAAAAEALRERLKGAEAELTAMTLALEEERKRAEETLAMLAAARAANEDLDIQLAAALLAQQGSADDLATALAAQETTEAKLTAALQTQKDLEDQLAAARSAQEGTEQDLADALLAQKRARADREAQAARIQELEEQLSVAESGREVTVTQLNTLESELAAVLARMQAQGDEIEGLKAELSQAEAALTAARDTQAEAAQVAETAQKSLEERLAEALAAKVAAENQAVENADVIADLRLQIETLTADLRASRKKVANLLAANEAAQAEALSAEDVRKQLAAALAAKLAAQQDAKDQLSAAEQRAALLAQAQEKLKQQEELASEAQKQQALLNRQVAQLNKQLASLQALLDDARVREASKDVQLQSLGNELNTALARVAAEEKRRREAEEEKNKLLEAQKQDLEKYKSEFFGRLRDVLGTREGIRIEGDRFVFSSEVLFAPGSADLSDAGRREISKVAAILTDVIDDIPEGIDWVIQVNGHTDDVPLIGGARFADNWELSQARALSVVRYMIDALDLRPERLSANGFGEFQPVNTDDTPEARAQNRRIELKFTEK